MGVLCRYKALHAFQGGRPLRHRIDESMSDFTIALVPPATDP
jgi:hypothetical protein